jgi:hypothetical protein
VHLFYRTSSSHRHILDDQTRARGTTFQSIKSKHEGLFISFAGYSDNSLSFKPDINVICFKDIDRKDSEDESSSCTVILVILVVVGTRYEQPGDDEIDIVV